MRGATLLLGAALALTGCGQGTTVRLQLRIAGDARKTPLRNPGSPTAPASDVDVLKLEAYNPTLGVTRQGEVTNDFSVSDQIKVGALDVSAGPDWRTQLVGNDRFGALYALGRSEAFEVPKEGAVDVAMVFGIADDFATSAVAPGGVGPFSTATLLPDGNVLVVGLGGAKLHEPKSGKLCAEDCLSGEVPGPRQLHTATALGDGRVLVIGGAGPTGALLGDAYLFRADTRAFSKLALAGLPERAGACAQALPDGRVLVAGGKAASPADGARVLVVDASAATATDVPALPEAVMLCAATALQSGEVLVTGGLDATGAPVASGSVYSVDGATVRRTPPMLGKRAAHTATLLADAYVFLFGGRGTGGASLSTAEAYTPGSKFIAVDTANVEPRAGHSAVRLDTDAVLLVGGQNEPAGPPDPARLVPALRFTPDRETAGKYVGTFVPVGQVVARTGATALALPDLSVLVVGGARPALAADPTVAPAAGDWAQTLELFVPCAVKGRACPK